MYSAAIVPLPNMRLLLLAHSGLAFDSPTSTSGIMPHH